MFFYIRPWFAGAVYKILSDSDRRALYDESGEIDDESDAILNEDKDWDQYWRLLFKVRAFLFTIIFFT